MLVNKERYRQCYICTATGLEQERHHFYQRHTDYTDFVLNLFYQLIHGKKSIF